MAFKTTDQLASYVDSAEMHTAMNGGSITASARQFASADHDSMDQTLDHKFSEIDRIIQERGL